MKLPMTEADLQTCVIDLAHLLGWKVAHFRPARTERGWRTPVQADGKGFPDLVMVHRATGIGLAVELKSARGQLTPEQQDWLDLFYRTGWWTRVWRPKDWQDGSIEATLRRVPAEARREAMVHG